MIMLMVIVMNRDKNNLDLFLEGLTEEGRKKIVYEKTYVRPSKAKSIFGFILSLATLIILVGLLTFNVMYFVLLIGNILILIFFSINTFTEKGLGLPRTIAYVLDDEEDKEEENITYFDEEYDDNINDEFDDENRQ